MDTQPEPIRFDDRYATPEPRGRARFPGLGFYPRMARVVFRAARLARAGQYTDEAWIRSSFGMARALEQVGCRLTVEGVGHFRKLDPPCVFIGNHMSTLETFVLPWIIRQHRPVTFVVKESLVTYPVFKHVMKSRDPVVVSRRNAKEDFSTVMREGARRLEAGTSIVVFPQTTRTVRFDPQHFNSLGVKLARRAGAPVVPLALRSDAWGNSGTLVKDFGRIEPRHPVRFAFGEPLTVTGTGKAENQAIIQFIQQHLAAWLPDYQKP
ncbi:MAG: lysophospholipid acyltransferase family protein [Opitutales bacterium]